MQKTKWLRFGSWVGNVVKAIVWFHLLFGGRFEYTGALLRVLLAPYVWLPVFAGLICACVVVGRAKGLDFALQLTSNVVVGFLLFPALAAYSLLRGIRRSIDRSSRLLSFPRRLEWFVVAALLGVAATDLVLLTSSRACIAPSLFVLGSCLILVWISLYSWVTNPYGLWERGIESAYRLWQSRFVERDRKSVGRGKPWASAEHRDRVLGQAESGCKFIEDALAATDRTRLTKYFLGLFSWALVTNILIFGFLYYGIQKLCPGSFAGLGQRLWESLYFSAATFVRYSPGDLYPTTITARLVVMTEVITTLFFLTIMIVAYNCITEEAAKTSIQKVQEKAQLVRRQIQEMKERGFGSPAMGGDQRDTQGINK
jgi:hypothetical protein